MNDQAQQLRNLKRQSVLADARDAMTPPVAALLGSKGGVGTTTLAVCLAEAVSKELRRISTETDSVEGQETPFLQLASCGTRIDDLACLTGMNQLTGSEGKPVAWRDGIVLGQLKPGFSCGSDASESPPKIVLADLGCWSGSDASPSISLDPLERLFLVTTEDTLAMMDTYACIKQMLLGPDSTGVGVQAFANKITVVINQVLDQQVATAAAERLALTCRRFLGVELTATLLIPMSESPFDVGFEQEGSTDNADANNVAASLGPLVENVTAVMRCELQPEPCLQL